MAESESGRAAIYRNISFFLSCGTNEITGFHKLHGGLSNTSYVFTVRGRQYLYRNPGDGNGKFVNRTREKDALEAARFLGLDPTYLTMDSAAGWKISRFIPAFREPDYRNPDDVRAVISVLRNLHRSEVRISHGIRPWNDACAMEAVIKKRRPHPGKTADVLYGAMEEAGNKRTPENRAAYQALRRKIRQLYLRTLDDEVKPVFCHGDTYAPNWMFLPDGQVILTDWEYAGVSDPGMDIGYFLADGMYDFDESEKWIRLYLGDSWNPARDFHFKAYVAIAAWYWMVWTLYRMAKAPAGTEGDASAAALGFYFKKWRYSAEKYAAYCS